MNGIYKTDPASSYTYISCTRASRVVLREEMALRGWCVASRSHQCHFTQMAMVATAGRAVVLKESPTGSRLPVYACSAGENRQGRGGGAGRYESKSDVR